MEQEGKLLEETVTLSQAKSLVKSLAHEHSLLLLSAPGVGKSDTVGQAARDAGLPVRSLLGTQIAPEDVSGIPRIVGERSVFCPPRVLLPENPEPFCLFLDELPAAAPDVQKALYSLLLERRLGEHMLPPGTWVVSAGNRIEDRALVRSISSALINRVIVLNIRVDRREWISWASQNGVRSEVIAFIMFMPDALMRPVPSSPLPFSTPRSWTLLSNALDRLAEHGLLTPENRRALAFGRVSAADAALFCAMEDASISLQVSPKECVRNPRLLPKNDAGKWFVLSLIRRMAERGELDKFTPEEINGFLGALSEEHRFAVLVDLVDTWGRLGAVDVMLASLESMVKHLCPVSLNPVGHGPVDLDV